MQIVTGWTGDYYERNESLCNLMLESVKTVYKSEIYIVSSPSFEEFGCFYDFIRFKVLADWSGEDSLLWIDPDSIMFKQLPTALSNAVTVYCGENYWDVYKPARFEVKTQQAISKLYPNFSNIKESFGYNIGLVYFTKETQKAVRRAAQVVLEAMKMFTESTVEVDFPALHHFIAQSLFFRVLKLEGIQIDTYQRLCNPEEVTEKTYRSFENTRKTSVPLWEHCFHLCFGLIEEGLNRNQLEERGVFKRLLQDLQKGKQISYKNLWTCSVESQFSKVKPGLLV